MSRTQSYSRTQALHNASDALALDGYVVVYRMFGQYLAARCTDRNALERCIVALSAGCVPCVALLNGQECA